VPVNKFGFSRWNFQFELNGSTTLDPEKDHKLLRRIAGRKKLFMDPLIASGFLRGKRVLDLGANSGYWSYVALAEGGAAHVTGVEAGAELVKQAEFVFKAKNLDPSSYAFHCKGAYEFLQSTTTSFDVIFCLGFFYHINDPLLLLKLMRKAANHYIVIDTIVHKSEDALISMRLFPEMKPKGGRSGS
jgi:2-polyprenyl-3-methyl-5-hydroxy-6-metoxy-1,4-benzoquinol methylase